MRGLAVLAERLAVIAGHDDQRRPTVGSHIVEQRRKRRVGRRDLTVVQTG